MGNAWRLDNPEKFKAAKKRCYEKHKVQYLKTTQEWRKRNPDKVKAANAKGRLRRYGMEKTQYAALLSRQDGLCAICAEILDNGKDTHIDHCHRTGAIRGILCRHCNLGLGHLKDSLEILDAMGRYLRRHTGG